MPQVFWVDPKKIRYVLREVYSIKDEFSILDGDWDINVVEFEKCPVYIGCHELLIEGKNWHDTIIYKAAIELIKQGKPQWMYRTVESFDNRETEIRNTFESLKKEVYDQQHVPEGIKIWNPDGKYKDEIAVAIGRNGNLLFLNGFHRTSIAKMLNLSKIPIRIAKIHLQWKNFCNEVEALCKSIWGERISYHPISHISFDDYSHQWSNKRFEAIRDNITNKNGTLLDIGSLFGYFSAKFEEIGYKCTAVENYSPFVKVLQKLKEANYYDFEVFTQSIFELKQFEFDVVLGLNIFHHFLKNQKDYEKFKSFLQNLKVKEMFVQLHDKDDAQMKNAYRNYDENEFLKFICDNARLTSTKQIYQENKRKLYKIC